MMLCARAEHHGNSRRTCCIALLLIRLCCTVPLCVHVCVRLCAQDLYVALPVPDALKSGENAGSFAFLEKELRFSQM